jgi:hypothetical protein
MLSILLKCKKLLKTCSPFIPAMNDRVFWRGKDKVKKTITYARISPYNQKKDLERQKKMLAPFRSANG